MPVTATLVKYHNELWMCDLKFQPQMLYKNWYDLKSRMRGTYINDVDVPEIFTGCTHSTSKITSIVWTDDPSIPNYIAVTAMSYRKSRTRNVWKLSKTISDKTAWKRIEARIRARAPDTDFTSGPRVCIGYIQNTVTPEYLDAIQHTDIPVVTFTGQKITYEACGIVLLADTDNLISELLHIAWLNTCAVYQNHSDLMATTVLYMPHSVILPSINVLWNPFSECWYYVK